MNNKRKLYKRDKRMVFCGTVKLKESINDIMHDSDEYLQSMYAAYPASHPEGKIKCIIGTDDGSKHYISVNPCNHVVSDNLERNLARTLYYSLSNTKTLEWLFDVDKNCFEKLFGLDEVEYRLLSCCCNVSDTLYAMLLINVRRFNEVKMLRSVTDDEAYKFVVHHLGNDLDMWTKIITHGEYTKVQDYRRIVPASEEFDTPAFVMYRSYSS